MPPLVRACYASILRHKGEHPVHLLTADNFLQFVDIPEDIRGKLSSGAISLAFFSDILRNALLSRIGGIWLDATIYLTQDLPAWPLPLFTIRHPIDEKAKFVSQDRWTVFCMGAVKCNPLNSFTYELWAEHLRKGRPVLDYFMTDYTYAFAYNNLSAVKTMMDNVPVSNRDLYYMKEQQDKPYDSAEVQRILRDNYIFKMSWKKAPQGTEGTLGQRILSGSL